MMFIFCAKEADSGVMAIEGTLAHGAHARGAGQSFNGHHPTSIHLRLGDMCLYGIC